MATFDNLPPSKPAPRRARTAPIFCVGWHAFVHWPIPASPTLSSIPLMDANGKPLANDLIDGQEVEILSWRPRSRDGLLYQVRRLADRTEWWIGAQYLRRQPVAEVVQQSTASVALR